MQASPGTATRDQLRPSTLSLSSPLLSRHQMPKSPSNANLSPWSNAIVLTPYWSANEPAILLFLHVGSVLLVLAAEHFEDVSVSQQIMGDLDRKGLRVR